MAAEAEELKEKLSVITHAHNKADQESSKYYEVIYPLNINLSPVLYKINHPSSNTFT